MQLQHIRMTRDNSLFPPEVIAIRISSRSVLSSATIRDPRQMEPKEYVIE